MIVFSDYNIELLNSDTQRKKEITDFLVLNITQQNFCKILSRDDCLLLVSLLKDSDHHLRHNAIQIFVYFSSEQNNLAILADDGLSLCMDLLSDPIEEIQWQALAALDRFLSHVYYKNQLYFIEHNGLGLLLPFLDCNDIDIKLTVIIILENLMKEDDSHDIFIKDGYLSYLAKLLSYLEEDNASVTDDEYVAQAREQIKVQLLVIFYHFSRNGRVCRFLAREDIIPKLQEMLKVTTHPVHASWIRDIITNTTPEWKYYLNSKHRTFCAATKSTVASSDDSSAVLVPNQKTPEHVDENLKSESKTLSSAGIFKSSIEQVDSDLKAKGCGL